MTAPTTAHEIFAGMARTLAEPARWTKGFAARDHHGMPVDVCSPKAVCHCLYGARDVELFKIADEAERARLDEETDEILHAVCGTAPSSFNDDRATTHADVLSVLAQSGAVSASRKA